MEQTLPATSRRGHKSRAPCPTMPATEASQLMLTRPHPRQVRPQCRSSGDPVRRLLDAAAPKLGAAGYLL